MNESRHIPTHPGAMSREQLTRRTLDRIGAAIAAAAITAAAVAILAVILILG